MTTSPTRLSRTDSIEGLDEILDEHGYPTDEALDLIPRWTGTPQALVEDLLAPIFSGYGASLLKNSTDDFGRSVKEIHLVTGGWSGCESAIGALDDGMFWFGYWRSSARGGRYVFEVPADRWRTPMPDWSHVLDAQERSRNGQVQARRAVATAAFGEHLPLHDDVSVRSEVGALTVTLFWRDKPVASRTVTASHAFKTLLG